MNIRMDVVFGGHTIASMGRKRECIATHRLPLPCVGMHHSRQAGLPSSPNRPERKEQEIVGVPEFSPSDTVRDAAGGVCSPESMRC